MIERFLLWVDDRLGTAHFLRHALRKAFPDHWSFMLGEINIYMFVILLATGTFLAMFFDPNMSKTVYNGPYTLLDGVRMSYAYRSVMALSFEVNLGLLVRQIHHWAALLFVAGIAVHMGRIFFTGAFRKPREINWVIGFLLFWLAIFEGFSGYSLPDDLLSGIGLRIAVAVLQSVPVVGTWLSFLLIGGVYPTKQLVGRLLTLHIYLVPFALAGLIALHLIVLWRQKHSQFPGPAEPRAMSSGRRSFPNTPRSRWPCSWPLSRRCARSARSFKSIRSGCGARTSLGTPSARRNPIGTSAGSRVRFVLDRPSPSTSGDT